jgi:TonB-linked SusC/RagA family outer membrane protein
MKKIFLLFILILAFTSVDAQQRKISGVVKSSDGETIPGANVIVAGTKIGTITDTDGKFSIAVPAKCESIIISFIGYTTRIVNIEKKLVFEIVLEDDSQVLEEVVKVGYGTQKRANLTGAVGTISAASIENKPITSASQSLAGKIAGVQVSQGSGVAGADGAEITIRGLGTLNNTSPLILIDGVISDNFDMINPSDIESISVLKDAASASIYGSKAGNGVILVTTKKGTTDKKTVFTYDMGYSTSEITETSKPKMITDPVVFMQLMNEIKSNATAPPLFKQSVIDLYSTPSYREACTVDWFDEIYKKGTIQEHNISAKGGTKQTQYFMSLGFMNQDAIIMDGNYKRLTARMNIETEIIPKVKMGTSIGYTYGNQRTPNGAIDNNSLLSILRATPLSPAYTDNGMLAALDGSTLSVSTNDGSLQKGNPLTEFAGNDMRSIRNNIVGNMFVEWEVIKDLRLKGTFAANINLIDVLSWNGTTESRNWRYKEILADPSNLLTIADLTNNSGFGSMGQGASRNYVLNPNLQLTYKKKIGLHNFSGLAAISSDQKSSNYFSTLRNHYESNYVRIFSAGDPSTIQNDSRISQSAVISQFGRINYSYDDRYLFEANIRRDGSSRFGANYKYGVFPSFSGGWIISNEKFFKSITPINFFKLRGSWGQLGNQGLGDFDYVAKVTYSNANYISGTEVVNGAKAESYGNPDLHWETTTMSNFGMDLHLFKSLINIEAEYFNRTTTNVLYDTPLPKETGFLSVMSNLASVENKGFEAAINFNKKVRKFQISGGINGSYIRNHVIAINPTLTGETDRYISITGNKILQRGEPINSYYLVNWTGEIYQTADQVANSPHQYNAAPGDLIFQDVSGPDGVADGKIDGYDRQVQGTDFPLWTFGSNLTLKYREFSVSVDFQGIADAWGYGSNEYFYPSFQGSNIAEHWLNRWTKDNPSLTTPRLWEDQGPNTENQNTYFLMDRSYLRLKNFVVSYDLPAKISKLLFLTKVRVYASGQNLYTWTNYKGFDPERVTNASARGGVPQTRIIKFGLNVTL